VEQEIKDEIIALIYILLIVAFSFKKTVIDFTDKNGHFQEYCL
jgi:hypothetical protein